jgi:transporter family protein
MPPWLIWTLLAIVSWGVWALLGKVIGDALSAGQVQALSTVGLLPFLLILRPTSKHNNPGKVESGSLLAFAGGIVACCGNIAYYNALNRGEKAATVVALTGLYPLITILLAVIFLREKLNRLQLAGVALSIGAIYLFNVQKEEGLISPWLLLALVPIGCWGITGFLQKLATNHISGQLATFWFLAAFVPVAGLLLWQGGWPAGAGGKTWMLVIAVGFTFAFGNLALLLAFARHGKASVITPLSGLYPLVSIPIAMVALHERIGSRETLGIVLALLSVVALTSESRSMENEENLK